MDNIIKFLQELCGKAVLVQSDRTYVWVIVLSNKERLELSRLAFSKEPTSDR